MVVGGAVICGAVVRGDVLADRGRPILQPFGWINRVNHSIRADADVE
jgi:hypothetical protein